MEDCYFIALKPSLKATVHTEVAQFISTKIILHRNAGSIFLERGERHFEK